MTRLLLLPGMDGTGALLRSFAVEVASWAHTRIVWYPTDVCLSVEQLVDRIKLDAPVTLIAESFSGAVGIRLAARHPALVRQLVLVNSFVAPPLGSGFVRLLGSIPFHLSPPQWALRRWLVGDDASAELVSGLSQTFRHVAPQVLAHRLASISRIDERASLRGLTIPVMTITARQDRLLSAKDLAELQSHAAGAKHLELDGPHLLLQARPHEAAELLRAQLSDQPA